MSTETPILKPVVVSNVAPAAIDSAKAALSTATNVDKQVPSTSNPPPLPAAKTDGVQRLIEELKFPESAQRIVAAAALGRSKDVAAVPALVGVLGDADADFAREAATSLGLLANPAAVEPLVAVVKNRDGYFHNVVRLAAIHSLGQLADLRAVEPLIDAIKDPIAEVSAEAIRSLALLSDPRRIPALLEVVRNEQGFYVGATRQAAITGLAHVGGTQADCELRFVAANQWEDAAVRAVAFELIREQGPVPIP